MRDWIIGLQKGAAERGEAFDPLGWIHIEEQTGQTFPEEMRDLYQVMDGGTLEPDVRLFHVRGSGGILEKSKSAVEGVPQNSIWFGVKSGGNPIFAVRKRDARSSSGPIPEWASGLSDESWMYGARQAAGG